MYECEKNSLLSPRKFGLIFLAYQVSWASAFLEICLTLNSALVAAHWDFFKGLHGRVLLIAIKE